MFSNLKKEGKKNQFRQSSSFGVKLQGPLGLFCSEATNVFLEIVPRRAYQEQQSVHSSALLCFVWSACYRVNPESCCILSAEGKCEPSHIRILHSSSQMSSLFSTLPSTFFLKLELQMADPCTALLFLWRQYHFKLLFHMKTFKDP